MEFSRDIGSELRRNEWKHNIEERYASGQTVVAWCTENNINVKSYYYWQKKLRDEANLQMRQEIVPLNTGMLLAQDQGGDIAAVLRVQAGTLEIRKGADAATLETVLRFLERIC